MRLSLVVAAAAALLSLAGIANAQQAHLMLDPHPAPLSRVEFHEIRVRANESSPDARAASAQRVAAAIAALPNPTGYVAPYRFENYEWRFLQRYPTAYRVYRDSDWLSWIPGPVLPPQP